MSLFFLGLFLGLLFGGASAVFATLQGQDWLKKRDARRIAEEQAKLAEERAKLDRKNQQKRERYAENPQVPLRSKARTLVRSVIYLEQKFRSECGYKPSELICLLECQFDPSMTFENYGPVWELDHIKPLKDFDLTDKIQFGQAIHPTNLRPLFHRENQAKGSK